MNAALLLAAVLAVVLLRAGTREESTRDGSPTNDLPTNAPMPQTTTPNATQTAPANSATSNAVSNPPTFSNAATNDTAFGSKSHMINSVRVEIWGTGSSDIVWVLAIQLQATGYRLEEADALQSRWKSNIFDARNSLVGSITVTSGASQGAQCEMTRWTLDLDLYTATPHSLPLATAAATGAGFTITQSDHTPGGSIAPELIGFRGQSRLRVLEPVNQERR